MKNGGVIAPTLLFQWEIMRILGATRQDSHGDVIVKHNARMTVISLQSNENISGYFVFV